MVWPLATNSRMVLRRIRLASPRSILPHRSTIAIEPDCRRFVIKRVMQVPQAARDVLRHPQAAFVPQEMQSRGSTGFGSSLRKRGREPLKNAARDIPPITPIQMTYANKIPAMPSRGHDGRCSGRGSRTGLMSGSHATMPSPPVARVLSFLPVDSSKESVTNQSRQAGAALRPRE